MHFKYLLLTTPVQDDCCAYPGFIWCVSCEPPPKKKANMTCELHHQWNRQNMKQPNGAFPWQYAINRKMLSVTTIRLVLWPNILFMLVSLLLFILLSQDTPPQLSLFTHPDLLKPEFPRL